MTYINKDKTIMLDLSCVIYFQRYKLVNGTLKHLEVCMKHDSTPFTFYYDDATELHQAILAYLEHRG